MLALYGEPRSPTRIVVLFARMKMLWIVLPAMTVLLVLIGGVWFFKPGIFDLSSSSDYQLAQSAAFQVEEGLTPLRMVELGEYYFNKDDSIDGEYDLIKARAYYEAALQADPKVHPGAWYELGRINFIEGKFNLALLHFEKQEVYFPESGINVNYMVGLTYGFKAGMTDSPEDWDKAAAAFEDFVAYEPNAPWPRVDLAWVYFAQGRYEDMKPVLEVGLESNPTNPWLLNMYGLALLNTDDAELALAEFKKAQTGAATLTAETWGRSYPGNDPRDWDAGLKEFQVAIDKNIALAESALTE